MKKISFWREKPKNAVLTIPNIITATGIIALAPYVVGVIYGWRWLILASLLWMGASDALDGMLARRLQQKTTLGEFLDPLRDRLILAAIMFNVVFLADYGSAWVWLAAIIFFEAAIVFHNLIVVPRGRAKVHLMGKLRQAVHLAVMALMIIAHYFGDMIYVIFGVKLDFPVLIGLPIMAVASLLALLFYVRAAR